MSSHFGLFFNILYSLKFQSQICIKSDLQDLLIRFLSLRNGWGLGLFISSSFHPSSLELGRENVVSLFSAPVKACLLWCCNIDKKSRLQRWSHNFPEVRICFGSCPGLDWFHLLLVTSRGGSQGQAKHGFQMPQTQPLTSMRILREESCVPFWPFSSPPIASPRWCIHLTLQLPHFHTSLLCLLEPQEWPHPTACSFSPSMPPSLFSIKNNCFSKPSPCF